MTATLEHMPREKKPPTRTVRIEESLAHKLEVIAAARKQSVPDVATELFGVAVEDAFREATKHLASMYRHPKRRVDE